MTTQTRFLSYADTSQLASEPTLAKLLETTENGITVALNSSFNNVKITDVNIPSQTTNLKVDVLSLPPSGSSTNITSINSEALATKELPITNGITPFTTSISNTELPITNGVTPFTTSISGTPNVNVTNTPNVNISNANLNTTNNLNTLKNITVDSGSGNSSAGTLRVVLSNDEPTLNVNILQNNTISKNSGVTDTNTQRVVIADNQSTLNVLTTNSIDKGQGNVDVNTQRVVLCNDQQTRFWEPVPIQKITTYSNIIHKGSWCVLSSGTDYLVGASPPVINMVDTTLTGWNLLGTIFLPKGANTAFYIRSTSVNDTAAGTGLRSISVKHVDYSGVLTTTNLNLNGSTDVLISNSTFRILEVLPTATGSLNSNDGTLFIVNAAASTNYYPGYMSPKTNRFQGPLIHIPPRQAGLNYPNTGFHKLDYIQYQWINGGAAPPEELQIRTSTSINSIWTEAAKFYNNNDQFFKVDLSNVQLPNNLGWDILVMILKQGGVGTTYLTWSIGAHTE